MASVPKALAENAIRAIPTQRFIGRALLATVRRRLPGTTLEERGQGLLVTSRRQPQKRVEGMHAGCKHSGLVPALTLLVHRMPRRQVMRHQAPHGAGSHDPAQAIAYLPQAMVVLRSVFRREGQIGRHKSSFVVIDITGVCFAFHTASLAASIRKCITPSRFAQFPSK